jgi:hypothetical protein
MRPLLTTLSRFPAVTGGSDGLGLLEIRQIRLAASSWMPFGRARTRAAEIASRTTGARHRRRSGQLAPRADSARFAGNRDTRLGRRRTGNRENGAGVGRPLLFLIP